MEPKEKEIDFVIMWVDGNDKKWQDEILKYKKEIDFKRYRDWGMLRYIFRGFEKNSPWVRKIHFVTYGHIPEWLNEKHPKINIVRHEDIMEKECLPTFNSVAIEVNIHKIKGIAEQFVFFNDDTYIIKKLKKDRFFKNGLPCDSAILNSLTPNPLIYILMNNLEIINKYFDKKVTIARNFFKYFNLKYGIELIRTICLIPWPKFTGFIDHHLPNPFLKSIYEEVWEKEKEKLEATSKDKFRNFQDVNQYLFRYWQFAKGCFNPINLSKNKVYNIHNLAEVREMIKEIKMKDYETICINDSFDGNEEELEEIRKDLNEYFVEKFQEKSSYEK